MEILIGPDDISPDKQDINGQTPLCCAAQNGNEGVVKMLLRRDYISPDKPDNHDQTLLSRPAGDGHEGVVQMLLGRGDIDPDRPGNNGQTPLSCCQEWVRRSGANTTRIGHQPRKTR